MTNQKWTEFRALVEEIAQQMKAGLITDHEALERLLAAMSSTQSDD